MVAVPRLRIKFGPEGSVKTFQKVPDIHNPGHAKLIEKSFGEDVNQSRKRGPNELEEVQAKKMQKLDRFLSSQCFTLLKLLMDQEYGWLFNEPVDPVKLKIPDYFSVVSKPMDLGTVKSRLLKNAYSSADEFAADVRLTFDNAMLYNPPDHFVHEMAKKFKEIFEVRWGSLERKKKLSKLSVSEVDCTRQRRTETAAASSGRLPKPVKEKSEKVSLLLKPVKGESKKDTPVVTPKALATKLRVKKLEQGLGISSTVKIPSKGSGLITSCKCGSCGRITCICLKSCNSSGSEVSSLTDCLVKNTSGSQATESDPQSNGSVSSRNEKNGCVSSQLDKPLNELKTTLPAMPPLPPEKALRAAILKGQFAETILRAKHRKVLDQNNNKADLIRIQIEKEQMERAQREEKARIVAEMRAAEIARRMRAETELKQKRERQRLELEMMRKTFDFEENNFLILDKDLVKICGSSNLTRTMLLKLGLLLRKDDCVEEMDSEIPDAMRIDDLEEGEIF
uniref:Transcription factor GTE12 n=1 Tax=Noccaea caerulescens TaxID=107243 RepID=A0A1J3GFT7_NOCCA